VKAHATVRLMFPSERNLEIVLKALKPETKSSPTPRSKVWVERRGNSLILRFEARDTVALRAAMNSYLRWISLINETCSVLETLTRAPSTV